MTAAVMTPSVVQKIYVPSTGKTGTPMRLIQYIFKVTKTNNADWILLSNFQSGVPISFNAITVDSSSDAVQEGTATSGLYSTNVGTGGATLTLSGGTVGTTYGEVWFEEAA